jgi:hypothetical protein
MRADQISWVNDGFLGYLQASEPVHVPLFSASLEVRVNAEQGATSPTASQLGALQQFLELPSSQRDALTHELVLVCHEVCAQRRIDGQDLPIRLARRADVWSYVGFSTITLPAHGATRDRYVFVAGGCDWDEEHGIELLFKNGRLFKLSAQDGLATNEAWYARYIEE